MRIRVNQRTTLVALCMALVAMPLSIARAQEAAPRPLSERWIYSIAAISGITVQKQDASVESRCEQGGPEGMRPNGTTRPPCTDPSVGEPGPLRPSDSGSETAVSPFVGGSLQVMTPAFESVPGTPRVFASVEFMAFFAPDRRIAKEGNPAGVDIPEDTADPVGVSSDALTGRGSAVDAGVQTWGFGANAGVAFPARVGKRRIWLKPSFGWLQYEVDIKGRVIGGTKVQDRPEIREIDLRNDKSRTYNAIGPGLEVELETGRYGPIASSLFIRAYAYKVIGERRVDMADQTACPPCTAADDGLGPDQYSARWSWKQDPWIYRGGVGMRLHWVGRD
jgi:hypothetical protein